MVKKITPTSAIGFFRGGNFKESILKVFKINKPFDEFYVELKEEYGDEISGQYVYTDNVDVHFDEFCKKCMEISTNKTNIGKHIYRAPIPTVRKLLISVVGTKTSSHFGPKKEKKEKQETNDSDAETKPKTKGKKNEVKKNTEMDDSDNEVKAKPKGKKNIEKIDSDNEIKVKPKGKKNVETDDSDIEVKAKPKGKKNMETDDSDGEVKTKPKGRNNTKPSKPIALSDTDDDEPCKVVDTARKCKKPAVKKEIETDDSDTEKDEAPQINKVSKTPDKIVHKKSPPKPKPISDEDEQSD